MVRAKGIVNAAVGALIALVFFPPWCGIPAAVLLGAWGVGLAALGGSVVVDQEAGLLVLRVGLVARRVQLTDVTAVLVERAKVSIARSNGGEISLYAWRRGPLDSLLGVPAVASDIGHAIASAVALAQAAPGADSDAATARPARSGQTPARVRSRLTAAVLGGWGLVAIVASLLVRVHWHNPVLTALGVVIALGLGVSGLFSLLFGLWITLTGRTPQATQLL